MKRLATLTSLTLLTLFTSCGQQIENLHDRIDATNRQVKRNSKQIDKLYDKLDALSININNIEVNQEKLQKDILANTVSISELENNTSVSAIINPCGNVTNQFDEVLLVMSDGSIIAYFEQGTKRFLTILKDGNYRTTDLQACNFSIVNGQYQE